MAKNNVKIPVVETTDKRDLYLGFLEDVINSLHHKAIDGKVRNPKNEKIKIDYFRALIYAINTANSVYKDKQLDKMERELEMLKRGLVLNNEKPSQNESELNEEKLKEIEEIDEKIEKWLGDD